MLSAKSGIPIAKIKGGKMDGCIIHVCDPDKQCCDRHCSKCMKRPCCRKCPYADESLTKEIAVKDGSVITIPKIEERGVDYIAGPSGSGKSTKAANGIKLLKKIHPDKNFYVFSRTDIKDDPVFKGIKGYQIDVDESLLEDPIDISKDLAGGSIVLFDDCNTIPNDKLRKAVEAIMADIMEVGRKMDIYIIITNHLVIPNEKKLARTIMNEMQTLTVFPKSGSAQQIRYVLKQYFGLNNNQIEGILALPSRWVTIHKSFPQSVIHEKGAFIL